MPLKTGAAKTAEKVEAGAKGSKVKTFAKGLLPAAAAAALAFMVVPRLPDEGRAGTDPAGGAL